MIGETRRTGASHSAESGAGPPSGLGTGPGGELPGGVVEDHAAFGDTRSLARAQAGGLADREGASLRYLLAVEASASTRDAVPARHPVEELRQALLVFREVYNTTSLIERHGSQTPAAARQNQLSPAAGAA